MGSASRLTEVPAILLIAATPYDESPTRACPDARGPEPCDDPRMSWTALIVDDHAAFRSAAGALLEAFGFDAASRPPD
jgi:hypothetical protein